MYKMCWLACGKIDKDVLDVSAACLLSIRWNPTIWYSDKLHDVMMIQHMLKEYCDVS